MLVKVPSELLNCCTESEEVPGAAAVIVPVWMMVAAATGLTEASAAPTMAAIARNFLISYPQIQNYQLAIQKQASCQWLFCAFFSFSR
ncbi:hypothetical protein L288_20390 [Sphingobium quisquiliarum P25]|uniref:Uncharacterized protein n=1 Tax=Sphingobium quisquiliarum P25 TaxID=1329909 RepID=T0HM01_9SPHN|nr:hypothetical protein L288_20390 [Sphingobium quisquiliarum P25]